MSSRKAVDVGKFEGDRGHVGEAHEADVGFKCCVGCVSHAKSAVVVVIVNTIIFQKAPFSKSSTSNQTPRSTFSGLSRSC